MGRAGKGKKYNFPSFPSCCLSGARQFSVLRGAREPNDRSRAFVFNDAFTALDNWSFSSREEVGGRKAN
jgi:hypothetical protein